MTDADGTTTGGDDSSTGKGDLNGSTAASARTAKHGAAVAGSEESGNGKGGVAGEGEGEGGGEWEDGRRRSPICETAQILTALVKQRVKTLAFCRTRKLTELTLRYGHQVGKPL